MRTNWLTLVVGLPRSGKSTWVEQHKGDAVVVSSDWIREHILGETYSYSSSANAIVWSIMDATIRIVLGQGKNAILDGVNLTRETRSYYVAIARRHGAKVRMMMINTPLATCLERNACSSSHKLPSEKLVEMDKSIEWPTKDECDELCCDIPFFDEAKPTLVVPPLFEVCGEAPSFQSGRPVKSNDGPLFRSTP